jgi:hypothetical protein
MLAAPPAPTRTHADLDATLESVTVALLRIDLWIAQWDAREAPPLTGWRLSDLPPLSRDVLLRLRAHLRDRIAAMEPLLPQRVAA